MGDLAKNLACGALAADAVDDVGRHRSRPAAYGRLGSPWRRSPPFDPEPLEFVDGE